MFHKAIDLQFLEGTVLEVEFQNGEVKNYDIAVLFSKYPQLERLNERSLFTSGKLMGGYGIVWDEDLDLEIETIYEDGKTVRTMEIPIGMTAGLAVAAARARVGISQKELSALTGIDQSDISKIERGVANPSVGTLSRIANAMKMSLSITFAE